jgi:hypothetical protein
MWIRRLIENYVVVNGCLPTGTHEIDVEVDSMRYSGHDHDFSDLK